MVSIRAGRGLPPVMQVPGRSRQACARWAGVAESAAPMSAATASPASLATAWEAAMTSTGSSDRTSSRERSSGIM